MIGTEVYRIIKQSAFHEDVTPTCSKKSPSFLQQLFVQLTQQFVEIHPD